MTAPKPDIVERLRMFPLFVSPDRVHRLRMASAEPLCIEAADEIRRLRSKLSLHAEQLPTPFSRTPEPPSERDWRDMPEAP